MALDYWEQELTINSNEDKLRLVKVAAKKGNQEAIKLLKKNKYIPGFDELALAANLTYRNFSFSELNNAFSFFEIQNDEFSRSFVLRLIRLLQDADNS